MLPKKSNWVDPNSSFEPFHWKKQAQSITPKEATPTASITPQSVGNVTSNANVSSNRSSSNNTNGRSSTTTDSVSPTGKEIPKL